MKNKIKRLINLVNSNGVNCSINQINYDGCRTCSIELERYCNAYDSYDPCGRFEQAKKELNEIDKTLLMELLL